jgi:N-acetyl-1-D-myo-inositol-2-amino-2-deoxy-alpha-D-glucopyranoside deacetylase
MVVAHPDDDAYGAAGAVALHAEDPGFRFILIHATDGGSGDIRPGFPATRESLGRIRMQEDADAWRAVGRSPDRHEWLGFPDGEVDQVPLDQLTDAVGQILDEEQPTVVATFGPDGIFGHPDHIAIGAATDAAFLRSKRASGTSFRRLLHSAVPQTVFRRWNDQRRELGLKVFDPSAMYQMRGVPDEQIGLIMDCRRVTDRIVAGLQQHRSQHHVMSDDPEDTDRWRRVTSRSWASVAWPPRTPGTPMLTDIFEGLP